MQDRVKFCPRCIRVMLGLRLLVDCPIEGLPHRAEFERFLKRLSQPGMRLCAGR
jgi:hypothetical protein